MDPSVSRSNLARIARQKLIRLSILLCALVLALPASSLTLRRVALTGEVAPGTGGALYLGFGPIVTNTSGEGAFTATLEQGGAVDASNDLGLWSEGLTGAIDSAVLVERQGSPAVSAPGTWGAAAAPPAFNDAGQVAFRASTEAPFAFGVWHEGSGVLAPVAVTGNPADGAAAGQNFAGPVGLPSFNDAGQVAFQAGLSGSGVVSGVNDRGVWSGASAGSLTLAARNGDLAPGSGGAAYAGFEGALVDGSGGVAFRATLDDGGEGLYAGPAAGVGLVARNGSAAPGTTGQFEGFFAPDLNGSGQLAFDGLLETGFGGVGSANDRGIWAGAPGGLVLLAREGDAATDAGGRVYESFSTPRLNAAGDVLYRASLDTGTGLFLEDAGTGGEKVAASGDAAPGTSIGFGDASFAAFSDWALNDLGEVVFEATLAGTTEGVTGANDGSLWLKDKDDVLNLVAREGMLMVLGLNDTAILESIDFYGDSAATGRGVANGFLGFGVTFTDGREALFIATPEPGSLSLLALGLVALARRRRS